MAAQTLLVLLAVQLGLLACAAEEKYTETVIIGAGPAGVQLSYYLEKAGRDYIALERNGVPGSFYVKYPRHRTLISINKFNTGTGNPEFNLRHDWNSLLDDEGFRFPERYSSDFWPDADDLVDYIGGFTQEHKLNVQYHTDVTQVADAEGSEGGYVLQTTVGNETTTKQTVRCKYLVIATGISVPKVPDFRGMELTTHYADMSVAPEDYRNASVLIIGRGNAAFEVAENLTSVASHLHMVGRSKQRFAWQTHYVGDLRAVNNNALDTYQLKSMTGLADDFDFESAKLKEEAYFVREDDGLIYLKRCTGHGDMGGTEQFCGLPDITLRIGYKHVINAIGFMHDRSIFTKDCAPATTKAGKYPKVSSWYESTTSPHMYFAGTIAHSRDKPVSSGGFIHGFRYTAKFLFNTMEQRNHQTAWPRNTIPVSADADTATGELADVIIPHVNEASGMYQMFHFLYDVFVIEHGKGAVHHYKEVSNDYLSEFFKHEFGTDKPYNFITLGMEFGAHGEGVDVFRSNRVDATDGTQSSFLHPVLRYYSVEAGKKLNPAAPLRTFHIPEDFVTEWELRTATLKSVAELATGWKSSGNLSDTVPQGGYEKLLAAYRHPLHVDPLMAFIKSALSVAGQCEALHANLGME